MCWLKNIDIDMDIASSKYYLLLLLSEVTLLIAKTDYLPALQPKSPSPDLLFLKYQLFQRSTLHEYYTCVWTSLLNDPVVPCCWKGKKKELKAHNWELFQCYNIIDHMRFGEIPKLKPPSQNNKTTKQNNTYTLLPLRLFWRLLVVCLPIRSIAYNQ